MENENEFGGLEKKTSSVDTKRSSGPLLRTTLAGIGTIVASLNSYLYSKVGTRFVELAQEFPEYQYNVKLSRTCVYLFAFTAISMATYFGLLIYDMIKYRKEVR